MDLSEAIPLEYETLTTIASGCLHYTRRIIDDHGSVILYASMKHSRAIYSFFHHSNAPYQLLMQCISINETSKLLDHYSPPRDGLASASCPLARSLIGVYMLIGKPALPCRGGQWPRVAGLACTLIVPVHCGDMCG